MHIYKVQIIYIFFIIPDVHKNTLLNYYILRYVLPRSDYSRHENSYT